MATAYYVGCVDELQRLALEAGRAAHMVRNEAQGYVALNHPEVATCDYVSGQIEGQLRALRGHLREGNEVKAIVPLLAKTSRFLGKILADDFLADAEVPRDRLERMKALLKSLREAVMHLDVALNTAILKNSSDLFGTEMPMMRIPEYEPSELIRDLFDPMDSVAARARSREGLLGLCAHLSNKAHAIQDLASAYTVNGEMKEAAGQVIGVAGQMENEARQLLNLTTTTAGRIERVPGPFNKAATKLADHLAALKDIASKPGFAIPTIAPELARCITDSETILAAAKAAAAA